MNYQPFGDQVLLEMPAIKDTTVSGIIKGANIVKDEQLSWDGTMKVAAVGATCQFTKVGMNVYTKTAKMQEIKINSKTYLQCSEFDLLGCVEKSDVPVS